MFKLFVLKFLLVISACGFPEHSPWQTDVGYSNLTQKHLEKLSTKDNSSSSFKIAITGDPQVVVGHFRNVIKQTNRRSDIDFIVVLGDLTDLGLRTEWNWIGKSIERSNKPVLTVVGNHDGLAKGDKIYKKMFGDLNYSFEFRGIKFVMWNNNYYEWGTPDFKWLENQIISHPKVIVMSHQPPYSGTLSPFLEQKWENLRRHPSYVASIHGHVHNYSHRYEKHTVTDVYTVDRVIDTHYGVAEFNDGKLIFEKCNPTCTPSVAR